MHATVKNIQALKEIIQEMDKKIYTYRIEQSELLAVCKLTLAELYEGEKLYSELLDDKASIIHDYLVMVDAEIVILEALRELKFNELENCLK